MDEAIGGRPSILPPCLIASAWGENPLPFLNQRPLDSVPPEPECETPESVCQGHRGQSHQKDVTQYWSCWKKGGGEGQVRRGQGGEAVQLIRKHY